MAEKEKTHTLYVTDRYRAGRIEYKKGDVVRDLTEVERDALLNDSPGSFQKTKPGGGGSKNEVTIAEVYKQAEAAGVTPDDLEMEEPLTQKKVDAAIKSAVAAKEKAEKLQAEIDEVLKDSGFTLDDLEIEGDPTKKKVEKALKQAQKEKADAEKKADAAPEKDKSGFSLTGRKKK